MQLKMQNILNFTSFYDVVKSQKLPIKTAYHLAQLATAIDKELQFYREKLQAIVQEYGEMDESGQLKPTADGSGIILRPGTESECYAAMQELQDLEIELPNIQFDISEFDNVELTMAELGAIIPFIKE